MLCSCTNRDSSRAFDLGVVLFCPYPDCDRADGPHATGRGSQIGRLEAKDGHLVLVDLVRDRPVRRFAIVSAAGKQEAVAKAGWSPGDASVALDLGGSQVSLAVSSVLAAARAGVEKVTL